MIDEDRTLQLFGYSSHELKQKSNKSVIAVCSECGKYRVVRKSAYRDLCKSCTQKGKTFSEEHKHNLSESSKGTRSSRRGKSFPEIGKRKISARRQGISFKDWQGYAKEKSYCEKFNISCRERNREKYGRKCFLCNKDEYTNGSRLSVHHTDRNKDQGCNDITWALVPLCKEHHGACHNDLWECRINYLLEHIW